MLCQSGIQFVFLLMFPNIVHVTKNDNQEGLTPLAIARSWGFKEVIWSLLDAGASGYVCPCEYREVEVYRLQFVDSFVHLNG